MVYKASAMLAIGVMMAGMTACSSDDEPTPPAAEPISLSRTETEMMQSQADFAISLLKTFSAENPTGNVGISPFSIQQVLSALGNGVSDEGRARYAQALGLTDISDLNALNLRLNEALPVRDPKNVSISIANGLWMNEDYTFNPDFVSVMQDNYKSETATYDFGSVNIADVANEWIAKKTHDGIKNLVPSVYNRNPDAVFILANALYFNGKWTTKFEAKDTKPGKFTDSYGNNAREVPMMQNSQEIGYIGYENYSMSTLSFGQGMYQMLIILPDLGTTPQEVLAGLTDASLKEGLSKMNFVTSKIYLPKFEMSAQGEITRNIASVGLPLNEFSYANICANAGVVNTYHGFSIRVDEEGAEIKAATATGGDMSPGFTPGPELRVDRPFIFAVYETSSKAILGLGIINDPAL